MPLPLQIVKKSWFGGVSKTTNQRLERKEFVDSRQKCPRRYYLPLWQYNERHN